MITIGLEKHSRFLHIHNIIFSASVPHSPVLIFPTYEKSLTELQVLPPKNQLPMLIVLNENLDYSTKKFKSSIFKFR